MITLKTKEQIEIMDWANKIVNLGLDEVEKNIEDGIETLFLDNVAESFILDYGATPAFKGYRGFPASLCVSINEEIVHGIPSNRKIKSGDIVSIDLGVKYKGFFGDAARTIIVGEVEEDIEDLVKNTKRALYAGIDSVKIGNRLYDINKTIEQVALKYKYGNIRRLCGHGVGSSLHEKPSVFNYINKSEPNIRLQEGLVLALEPMFSLGGSEIKILDDGWTAITNDRSLSAHWELSVAILDSKAKILGL